MSKENDIYFSVINVWEIAIKHAIHPDQIGYSAGTFMNMCREAGYRSLDGKLNHVLALESLRRSETAPRHRDPFDRFLLAQAKAEGMVFMTCDSLIPYYNETCILKV